MKEFLKKELHEVYDWVQSEGMLENFFESSDSVALIASLAQKSNLRFTEDELSNLHKYLFAYEDVYNAEKHFGVKLPDLLDQVVMISLFNENFFKAKMLGMGDDGFGGMCVYYRQEGSSIVEGAHYSRIRLIKEK